jgi:hypothetical protein
VVKSKETQGFSRMSIKYTFLIASAKANQIAEMFMNLARAFLTEQPIFRAKAAWQFIKNFLNQTGVNYEKTDSIHNNNFPIGNIYVFAKEDEADSRTASVGSDLRPSRW